MPLWMHRDMLQERYEAEETEVDELSDSRTAALKVAQSKTDWAAATPELQDCQETGGASPPPPSSSSSWAQPVSSGRSSSE
ncbi:Beta-1,4-Galactosyltransferase 1 [Manis pentadactyla]|nr:Beta-1,4-Galactosyltransferase 1 [Manis pentadactyla]